MATEIRLNLIVELKTDGKHIKLGFWFENDDFFKRNFDDLIWFLFMIFGEVKGEYINKKFKVRLKFIFNEINTNLV